MMSAESSQHGVTGMQQSAALAAADAREETATFGVQGLEQDEIWLNQLITPGPEQGNHIHAFNG